MLNDAGDKSCAAARNNNVDEFAQATHDDNGVAVENADKLNSRCGNSVIGRRRFQNVDDFFVRANDFTAAAQKTCVAGFYAQGDCIRRDVRAGFVNHAHDAERDAYATNF